MPAEAAIEIHPRKRDPIAICEWQPQLCLLFTERTVQNTVQK